MCGRFHLCATPEQIAEYFNVMRLHNLFEPRYNIAPSQPVLIVRESHGHPEMAFVQWGLVPQWANDPLMGSGLQVGVS